MSKKFTVAYINADRSERELSAYALESPETQARTFASRQALLSAPNAKEFDCVLVADARDGDVMQLEEVLYDNGHVMPVIGVAETSDLPALVDALRRGQSTWNSCHLSG
jgi:FixJ family two-component response regulator